MDIVTGGVDICIYFFVYLYLFFLHARLAQLVRASVL